ncbi:MAG: DNA replication/repair protein RecF [Vulcanimicrobiaceae bacterium]
MLLERLSLANFRNYASLEWEPAGGLNLILGSNAQGKSNLLEAIALLATGKSFRAARESELIRFGGSPASVVGSAHVGAGSLNLACSIASTGGTTRKTYTINGEGVRYARFLGSLKVVTFVPDDLGLVSGPPAMRRAMLNEALSLADRRYYHELARYRKAALQKNALLRDASSPDRDLLATYDATMVQSGTALMLARRHYIAALGETATSVYGHWIPNERLEVRYAPNVVFDTPSEAAVAGELSRRLSEQRPAELARKRCLVGPHRDDVELTLDAQALARFGSQGQKRTAVLALKLAEYAVMRDRTGESPLLLLDDVLSELDAARAQAFLDALHGSEQAFVTATEPVRFGLAATAWRVAAGAVTAC